uniref:Tumor necrosis factor receptor superfamily member 14-like n=1 Tax=Haplochromis burtoni TaxID=8153 RepID=A0A3Q3CZ42_HAPBU
TLSHSFVHLGTIFFLLSLQFNSIDFLLYSQLAACTVVQRDCTAYSGTRCRSCDLGTFMNQLNGLSNCFPCTTCDTGHGLFVKRNCTAKTDTVCDVLNGYYCKRLIDSNGCSLAEKHSQCEAGQRIKESGTSRSDTVCEDCQPGFFSKDGVKCTAWKT